LANGKKLVLESFLPTSVHEDKCIKSENLEKEYTVPKKTRVCNSIYCNTLLRFVTVSNTLWACGITHKPLDFATCLIGGELRVNLKFPRFSFENLG